MRQAIAVECPQVFMNDIVGPYIAISVFGIRPLLWMHDYDSMCAIRGNVFTRRLHHAATGGSQGTEYKKRSPKTHRSWGGLLARKKCDIKFMNGTVKRPHHFAFFVRYSSIRLRRDILRNNREPSRHHAG